MIRFGVNFKPNEPIGECLAIARLAESAEMHNVWISDNSPNPPHGDVFQTFREVARSTTRIMIGTGVCNPYTRHPAIMASNILSLQELTNGRAVLGIGAGGPSQLERFGFGWNKPLETVEETIDVLRMLFRGEEVSFKGRNFTLSRIRFRPSASKVPIYISARGPRMLRLAGRKADGVLLTSPLSHVPTAIQLLKEGARDSGRSLDDLEICTAIDTCVSQDRERARQMMKAHCARRIAHSAPDLLASTGLSNEKVQKVKQSYLSGAPDAAGLVDDEMIDVLCLAGTLDEFVAQCRKFVRAGSTQIIIYPPYGPDGVQSLQSIAEMTKKV
jgi:5,10-methylenetetrahydromethanopterin reductase